MEGNSAVDLGQVAGLNLLEVVVVLELERVLEALEGTKLDRLDVAELNLGSRLEVREINLELLGAVALDDKTTSAGNPRMCMTLVVGSRP